jgi:hypothetical protein
MCFAKRELSLKPNALRTVASYCYSVRRPRVGDQILVSNMGSAVTEAVGTVSSPPRTAPVDVHLRRLKRVFNGDQEQLRLGLAHGF